MKNRLILIMVIVILSSTMISCVDAAKDNDTSIIETFGNIIETIATIPLETILPTVAPETEPIIFDKDITFTYEYISDTNIMPYGLFTPSSSSNNEPSSLIVWLHGAGERSANKELFLERGLPKVLNNWSLDGFNAYILCPHLKGEYNNWCSYSSANNLRNLLDEIIAEYNIDTNNIVVVGASMGGYGAVYMAYHLEEYFSKLVVLSGYNCSVNLEDISIPTIGYVGTYNMGEDAACIRYMKNAFIPVFGKENAFSIESSHANLPNAVFNEDKDDNNRSDVIEWMFDNE